MKKKDLENNLKIKEYEYKETDIKLKNIEKNKKFTNIKLTH